MTVHRPIGGFFELEQPHLNGNYHKNGIGLSNGRTCFNIILKHSRASNVYVPFYSCDTLLSPLHESGISVSFYSISEKLEPIDLPPLKKDELFLYINYFGIKGNYIRTLIDRYGDQLIIDNTHSYFERGYEKGSSFNSSRKFFGVPDGGFLYSSYNIGDQYERNKNFNAEHLILRLDQRQEEAFTLFQKNEALQSCKPLMISHFTETVLEGVNYNLVRQKRIENYNFYNEKLKERNTLCCVDFINDSVPFCYPFLIDNYIDPSFFYNKGIFIPMLWKEVITRVPRGFEWERKLSMKILPLPIDHRYDSNDLQFVIDIINEIT